MRNSFIVFIVSLLMCAGLCMSCKSSESKKGTETSGDTSAVSGIFTGGCISSGIDNVSEIDKVEIGGTKIRLSVTLYAYNGSVTSCLEGNKILLLTQTYTTSTKGTYKGATILSLSYSSTTAEPLSEAGVTTLEKLVGSGANFEVGSQVNLSNAIELGSDFGEYVLAKVEGDKLYLNSNYDPDLGDGNEDATKGDVFTRVK